jgi:hypothetical protein
MEYVVSLLGDVVPMFVADAEQDLMAYSVKTVSFHLFAFLV